MSNGIEKNNCNNCKYYLTIRFEDEYEENIYLYGCARYPRYTGVAHPDEYCCGEWKAKE